MARRHDAPMTRLEPDSLRQQAERAIRSQVLSGEIASGELYSVGYFASRLGVSPTPIRDALFDLVRHGLLTVVRNRGFRVITLLERDIDEIIQIRQMAEVPATVQVAGRLSPEDIELCRDYVDESLRCAAQGDLIGFLDADRDFHLHVLQLFGNRRLTELVGQLRDQARLYYLPNPAQPQALTESARQHEEILAALATGHPTRVEELMRHHLEHGRGIWAKRAER